MESDNTITTGCPRKNGALACCYSVANAPFFLGHPVLLVFTAAKSLAKMLPQSQVRGITEKFKCTFNHSIYIFHPSEHLYLNINEAFYIIIFLRITFLFYETRL